MVQSPTRARSIQSSNFGTILMVVLFSIAVIHSISKSLTSYNVYFKVAKDSSKSAVVTGDILADSKVNIDSVDESDVDSDINIMTDKVQKGAIEDNEEEEDELDIDVSSTIDESNENLVKEEAEEKEEAQNDDDEDDGEKETKPTGDNEKMETVAGHESGEDTQNDTRVEEKVIDEMKRDDSIKDKGDTEEAEKENDQKDEPDDGTDINKNTTAQDVIVIDEDVNDFEDDPVSTKENESDVIPKDQQVVDDTKDSLNKVAPEDPVETSTEI